MFDEQRFREQIEALILAIGAIQRHAAPDRRTMDAIIQEELDRAHSAAHAGTPTVDPDAVTRLIQPLARWRGAEADRHGGARADNDAPEASS